MKSEKKRILDYLQQGNQLNKLNAANVLDCNNLSKRIYDLKQAGHNIVNINEDKEGADAMYVLKGAVKSNDTKQVKEAKKPDKPAQPGAPKKKRVIETILSIIQRSPDKLTQEEILEQMVKEFPERKKDSMASTIRVQLNLTKRPCRMEREKNVEFEIARKGETTFYSIKK